MSNRSGGATRRKNLHAKRSSAPSGRKPDKPSKPSNRLGTPSGSQSSRSVKPTSRSSSQGPGAGRAGRPSAKSKPSKRGKQIARERFINAPTAAAPQAEYVAKNTFASFGFDPRVERNIASRGYVTPTQIQDVAIGAVLAGRDLFGMADTGSGKTAAFVLPIIERLLRTGGKHDALIIAPTRELAVQIDEEFHAFAKGLELRSCVCVGGANINRQINQLRAEPHVIIGTPGRLKDLLHQGELDLGHTDTLVLDEADRMLDMGFIRDVRALIDAVPTERQSLCLSATITPEIEKLIDELLNDPVKASVRTSMSNEHIRQDIVEADGKEEKVEVLHDLLLKPEMEKVIIFGSTKWGVQKLADKLTKRGLAAEAIHGNKSQPQRQRSLKAFAQDKVGILVATDVASRGLDIPAVSHVINFDEPQTYEDYIHRIGRTGRAGNSGSAITFVSRDGG